MRTSKLPAPPAQADDASARSRGANWQGFRSLSRAMFRGFVRDRAALFFTILFPVLFLLLFGSIYKSSSTPKINVVEVGRVAVLDQARAGSHGQLDKVLIVTHSPNLAHALNEVRQGTVDAAVQQQGSRLVVHYSIANPTTAGVVTSVFSGIVQAANQAASGLPPAYQLATAAGRGQVAQADPVPDAGPARLGDRLRRRVRGGAHPGRVAEEQAAAQAPASPGEHGVDRHRPDRGQRRGRDRRDVRVHRHRHHPLFRA